MLSWNEKDLVTYLSHVKYTLVNYEVISETRSARHRVPVAEILVRYLVVFTWASAVFSPRESITYYCIGSVTLVQ